MQGLGYVRVKTAGRLYCCDLSSSVAANVCDQSHCLKIEDMVNKKRSVYSRLTCMDLNSSAIVNSTQQGHLPLNQKFPLISEGTTHRVA